MSKKYIHFGHTHFDPRRFVKPRNRPGFTKPSGGFWASPVDAEFGWKDWCKDNDFCVCDLRCSFTFTLNENARVLTILSSEGARCLPQKSNELSFLDWVTPDFEKLVEDGWDAIEVCLSSDWGLYNVLYGWDCDSIVILNPDVIVVDENSLDHQPKMTYNIPK